MNRNTLLIVDDVEVNRAILRSLFEHQYNILEAQNGEQALILLNQYREKIEIVLLDIIMPVKDGYQVLKEMSETQLLSKIPVIVITSEDSSENEVRVFDLGASDILMKPFEPYVVRRRVQNVVELNRHKLHLEELVEQQAMNLRQSKDVLMDALTSVIEHRSVESGQHVLRIRMFTKVLLEDVMRSYPEYGLDERKIEVISSAASLHDIGKIAIPDAILNKPGRLTAQEFEIMKTHTEKGCEILAGLERMHDQEYLQYAYNICRYHHERWDGKGYPDGLKGENIPICAQVVGVADAYDALTTDRVYKTAYAPEKACNMILNGECGTFSPRLLECFKNVQEQFFELAKNYADGRLLDEKKQRNTQLNMQKPSEGNNTLELGQMKYFSMLRYENSTVMELDADSGIYHLVYTHNSDLDIFRSGGLFQEVFVKFIEACVHPDEQKEIMCEDYLADFLSGGLMRKTRSYHIFHHATGEYVRYEVTTLRINLDDPKQHKLLLVWREQPEAPYAPGPGACTVMGNSLIGIQQCRNDRWFTITSVNDGFISLFGYSKEDIHERFHDRYAEMIYPADLSKVRRQFHKNLSSGNSFELEYRVVTRDERVVWIIDKCQVVLGQDGNEYLNCALIDITQTKQEQEKLRLTMERHQIIMDQTNDIIFEWDIHKNTISYSTNWNKKYGYEPIVDDVSHRLLQASHVMPEDLPALVKIKNDIAMGNATYGEVELRIADADGRYIWSRIRATTQFDDQGNPVKAVGVILDIDSEKRRSQDLIDKAERDNLTHLYNKTSARQRIQKLMKREERTGVAAMMIIDLDNFKMVNDTLGHMVGDTVLIEAANQLQKMFRSQDIVSRIGGDEFLVYVNCMPDKERLLERVSTLIDTIQNLFVDELRDCRLSCSVGIACFPEDSDHFQGLFQCCDQALYRAKALGKKRFVLYEGASENPSFGLEAGRMTTVNTRIESDESFDQDTAALVRQSFQILCQAKDTEAAIQSILEMLGRKYNVSRTYIFEETPEGSACRNTFEWCNDGVTSEKAFLQEISYASLTQDYHENFDENGIFYCTDISTIPEDQYQLLKKQGIRSMLQCAILDTGKFAGFVGFDDCNRKRMWTQSQINALTFLSELLSMSLLKKRAQDRVMEAYKDLRMLLNTQNSWIYVIDPDSFRLQYINAKTHEIVPEARVGMHCYEAFFHRSSPCAQCPARGIREKVNHTMEIYNPVLKVWSIADASLIRWSGKDACLLSCQDITSYKK